jgi:hypothetical protein
MFSFPVLFIRDSTGGECWEFCMTHGLCVACTSVSAPENAFLSKSPKLVTDKQKELKKEC